MCSPSQGPCCTAECTLKYGDKCRDDNGCRDPSYCDGRMPHCPPSVNKPNKTICNKEFVCFMGVSGNRELNSFKFELINFPDRNVLDLFVWRMDWSLVNAFPVRVILKQNHASCAARFLARATCVKARSNGTRRLTMFLTCSPSLAHLATITLDIVTFFKSVEK